MSNKKSSSFEHRKKKATDANQPKIVMIPIDNIKPCRWGTGIRDLEVFERLKENIKQHGLNSPIRVFPLSNGFYEAYIGDHRVLICRDLGWKEVPCIIDEIDENEALERCISDNICRSDYGSVELENKVTELWNSGRYQAKVVLGNAVGLSGQRVGQILSAKTIRDSPKVPFNASISTQCINDTYPLSDINEKLALLELVRAGKIKPSDVKEHAKTLKEMAEESRKKVLYEGLTLLEALNQSKVSLPTKTYSKTLVQNPNLFPQIYAQLDTLEDHIALIKEDDKKKEAINYVKFYTGLFLKILYKQGVIQKEFFESLVRHELQIDESMLHHFDGLRTKGVDWWLKDFQPNGAEEEE